MEKKLLIILLIINAFSLNAQQTFSIQGAVDYALKNHANIKNSQVDMRDAELQIKEIKVTGLPQINGQFQYTYNAIVPTQLLDAKNFDPTAAEGDVVKFKFGVPWAGQAGVGLNQLIFDATWLVGLRAADTYRKLASQNYEQTKITTAEGVIKAYYSVLVAEERSKLLDLNITRLDSIILETKEFFKQGFVEKIDIDRLEVQKNNAITEKQKVVNLIALSYQLLKFQMGFSQKGDILLSDKLTTSDIRGLQALPYRAVDYDNRVEYTTLQTQRKLTELNIERYQKAYYPTVGFAGSLGIGHSNPKFNPFERWFPSSALSLNVNIPIYDSGMKKTQIERQRLSLIKIDQSAEMLRESFELQNDQAMINLKNGLQSLDIQNRNMELAQEVVRVSKIKYQQGTGSNLEIINAESDLKQAQTNYFASLYDVLIAKVDLDKAHGKLLTK
ncbi:TolC family protein [Emticicia sp. CRIBPO]|uniref:TolC family protein n=1 Tax=Emticicia sp. CRIBPO TaxID=2683258 RepID=UPI001412D8E8|nr:TolC family protein [Emticicia sp. CRIBPO]NBA86386.1 TolC family protein [Emticicia sp. CRIBPO]